MKKALIDLSIIKLNSRSWNKTIPRASFNTTPFEWHAARLRLARMSVVRPLSLPLLRRRQWVSTKCWMRKMRRRRSTTATVPALRLCVRSACTRRALSFSSAGDSSFVTLLYLESVLVNDSIVAGSPFSALSVRLLSITGLSSGFSLRPSLLFRKHLKPI